MSEWQDGYSAGYTNGYADARLTARHPVGSGLPRQGDGRRRAKRAIKTTKPTRKASAYSKRYGKAFKRLAPKFKKKSGGWVKNGFKRCAAAARRAAKK